MRRGNLIKSIMLTLLVATFMLGAVACGGTGSTGGGKKRVVVSIPAASSAMYSWQAMETAYEKLNPDVDVKIETNTDAADYQTKLMNALSGGVDNVSADIVVANEVGQYLTTCFVDYMPYLAQPNPYANNQIWRDTLEEIAYATYGADDKLYTLSFDTTQVFIAYSVSAFNKCGLKAEDIKTWDDLVHACEVLSSTTAPNSAGKSYVAMAFGGSRESMGMPLGWLIRTYADQYFRDFSAVAHSQYGDYTFDPDIDSAWAEAHADDTYQLAENATAEERIAAANFDSPAEHTINPLRAYNAYFNDPNNTYNPLGARWQDMFENLHEIFGTPEYLIDELNADHGTALTHMYTSRAGMAVVASDFFVSYAQQYGITLEQATQAIGIIPLPPMTDHGNDRVGAPASNYTRALGGPNGFYGVVNKSKEQTDLAMDFLMYVFSKQGQEVRVNNLAANGGALNGPVLVKDVEIPEEVQYVSNALYKANGNINFFGESDYNPILLVSSGLRGYNGSYEAHIDDELKGVYYNYFNPNAQSGKIETAAECGRQVFEIMKSWQDEFFEIMNYRQDCLNDVSKDPAV